RLDDTVETQNTIDTVRLENRLDNTHLVLSGEREQAQPFVERRKHPADVLRKAIEQEPTRSDLRLKLLELYYLAASQNRQAFLAAAAQLEEHRELVSDTEWSRIAEMGRTIAPENELFTSPEGSNKGSKAVA